MAAIHQPTRIARHASKWRLLVVTTIAGGLLLLGEIDRLALEHGQQRLTRLENLHICRLGLADRLVVIVARRNLLRNCLIDLVQPLGQRLELCAGKEVCGKMMANDGFEKSSRQKVDFNVDSNGENAYLFLNGRLLLLLLEDGLVYLLALLAQILETLYELVVVPGVGGVRARQEWVQTKRRYDPKRETRKQILWCPAWNPSACGMAMRTFAEMRLAVPWCCREL